MARFEFRLPDIGEGIAEGEVVAWHVTPGQQVVENQEMVEVMTDKATVTIGVPRKGRIAQLNASIGERVKVGSVLVVIDDTPDAAAGADKAERNAGALANVASKETRPSRSPPAPDADTARSRFQAPASRSSFPTHAPQSRGRERALRPVRSAEEPRSASSAAGETSSIAASAVGDIREDLPGASFFARGAKASASAPSEALGAEDFFIPKPLATPATRKLARDLGVDLRRVSPTGPHGRVTKEDVRSCTASSVGAGSGARHAGTLELATAEPHEQRKPFVGMRRRIAERMQLATQKAAHFTFVEEVEVDRLMAVIERLREPAERAQVKLHYLPFIVKAATLALKKHPILNSMLDEANSELVYRRYYHIGVATATEQGLVVPVVRDADHKSVLTIARDIQRLAEGARLGKLGAAELSGSTFTVTSLGKHGGLLATPILNHPEVGILGVHRVKQRPVVRAGQIVVGHVMNLSLSFDHRIVDGHVGAAFAYDLIAYLEDPELLLLELS
jgi:pyruvate dehydrogenase E2 component (dihydrolipoamide acetyltransferase)